MTNLPKTLPDRLRKAGLKVVEIDGWEKRGRPANTGSFNPVGVLNHHTGSRDEIGDDADDLTYAKWMFLTGRSDLPAPLCQLAISAEGVVYVGAAGRANHAGTAKASGSVAQGDGNSLYVGIEWMLSGSQPIPKKMYDAGVKTNGVLTQMLGGSVQTISCHYQTSVTGKWDIGDPDGVSFGSQKVLNVGKFRDAVKAYRARSGPKGGAAPGSTVLTFQHTSLQFSDGPAQQEADAERLFKRGRMMLSGTESGPDNHNYASVKAAAKKHGYLLHIAKSVWVAVKRDQIQEGTTVRTGYIPVMESTDGSGMHGDRGVVWMTFTHKDVGRMSIGCGHYLTNGRKPSDPNFNLNRRMAAAIGDWARDKSKDKAIVFYSGDQNIVDRTEDTFFGSPLTSAWDEVKKWEDTGHGNIDVIASFDADGRVKAKSIKALDDKELRLNTDHFLVEADYVVKHA